MNDREYIKRSYPAMKRSPVKGPEYAREIVAAMKRETASKIARVKMAEMAIRFGNYTEDGKDVFRDYLATGCD